MSGDLKHPSKAIPKGTLSGLSLTFMAYTLVILAMAATITRESFYNDANIVQNVSKCRAPYFDWLLMSAGLNRQTSRAY
jgi:amino acid transporter